MILPMDVIAELTSFLLKNSIIFISSFFLLGCAGVPPVLEYNKADVAYMRAKREQGEVLSVRHWKLAFKNYLQAKKLYDDRQYNRAKQLFLKSRFYFERAEEHSLIQKFRKGEL